MVKDHTYGLVYLLEILGFIAHPGKTLATPTQDIEFLLMITVSQMMELCLPGQKIN